MVYTNLIIQHFKHVHFPKRLTCCDSSQEESSNCLGTCDTPKCLLLCGWFSNWVL